jgi:hypothetical protein
MIKQVKRAIANQMFAVSDQRCDTTFAGGQKKSPGQLRTGRHFPHTHSGKNNVQNVIDNKTNAYYTKKDADGAEAVHIVNVSFSCFEFFHGTRY